MNLKKIGKHALWIFALGAFSILVLNVSLTITITLLRARSRLVSGSFLGMIWDVNGWVYEALCIPVMWIQPQSMFDNEVWTTAIIGVFWGLTLYSIRLCWGYFSRALAKRIRRVLRERSEKKFGLRDGGGL
jgi:hypothetical protein